MVRIEATYKFLAVIPLLGRESCVCSIFFGYAMCLNDKNAISVYPPDDRKFFYPWR